MVHGETHLLLPPSAFSTGYRHPFRPHRASCCADMRRIGHDAHGKSGCALRTMRPDSGSRLVWARASSIFVSSSLHNFMRCVGVDDVKFTQDGQAIVGTTASSNIQRPQDNKGEVAKDTIRHCMSGYGQALGRLNRSSSDIFSREQQKENRRTWKEAAKIPQLEPPRRCMIGHVESAHVLVSMRSLILLFLLLLLVTMCPKTGVRCQVCMASIGDKAPGLRKSP
ncbi:hypothetical protein BD289DRAFT_126187 [Coniella lustricola]|uniref:Uncharacterized protein n=1 Tax=Coniella lustricola TaxID=2025994 RepID=A0A2T3AFX7_9PEZI|nr:hypothetical protein BD289DRAFT_126187 [Coniella lustricola]